MSDSRWSRCIAASFSRRRWTSTSSRTARREGSPTTAPPSISANCSRPPICPTSAFPAFAFSSAVGRPGLSGSGDLSGRELLSRQGARPDVRGHGARPVDSHRRSAGRGISAFSRGVDRKADARRQCFDHSRVARLGERHRRLSLHAAPRRGDDHRHRTDDFRARRRRPFRPGRDERHLSVRRPRSIPRWTKSARTFTRSTGCRCSPARANGFGGR